MEELLYTAKTWLAWSAIAAMTLMLFIAFTWNAVRDSYVRARPWSRFVFFVAVAGITLYGGSKHKIGSVSFPYTDPETRYLTDNGSYVTNDWVHISYNKNILVPLSANLFVYRCDVCYTNDLDIATNTILSVSNTIAGVGLSFDHIFEAATNYNWFVFTDWTPPPVTHTNGVAFVMWQKKPSNTNEYVMLRTGIYTNMIKIAPGPAMTNIPPFSPSSSAALLNLDE